jgi:low temperature requirement protein LtrA
MQSESTNVPSRTLLRERQVEARVGFAELFFDLVFVFAVTQLSHFLLRHFTPLGAIETGLLLMAVWWVWIYTSWVTNWLDPAKTPVRLMLFVLMVAGLVLSTSIPEAFESRGLAFALAYTFMQVGRSAFAMWALKDVSPANYRTFQRITAWFVVSAPLWIAGGLAAQEARLGLWATAIALEFAGPASGYFVPGLGRSQTTDWDISGAHMAERCGLFTIIALGESILVTGATVAELEWTWVAGAAFLAALVGSIAMWWIYFNVGAERGSHLIARSADPGRVARIAYTYLHLPIVGGIILAAVGDEFLLAHPEGHADAKIAIAIAGGGALYLVGNALFKRAALGYWPLSHLAGLALLGVITSLMSIETPLMMGAAVAGVLVLVAAWETRFAPKTPARRSGKGVAFKTEPENAYQQTTTPPARTHPP